MRMAAFVSESAQWTITSWTDHSPSAGRHCRASGGTVASAARSHAGPAAYRSIIASRSVVTSATAHLLLSGRIPRTADPPRARRRSLRARSGRPRRRDARLGAGRPLPEPGAELPAARPEDLRRLPRPRLERLPARAAGSALADQVEAGDAGVVAG